ncbi:MAG: aldolase/citrate lyase family protein [bacterium]|nr:aldolase/citrate lyase family protein [bacterium]
MSHPRLIRRMLKQCALSQVAIIFDLEDGLHDVFDAAHTVRLKAEGRENLLSFVSDHADLLAEVRTGVRVNASHTPYFPDDLALLTAISHHCPLHVVMLSKVESAAELVSIRMALNHAHLPGAALLPIVETVAGLAALESITAVARHVGAHSIAYGHYDYSVDAKCWPLIRFDHQAYWQWVSPIIHTIQAAGLRYVNAPLTSLENTDSLFALLNRLHQACGGDFGLVTVSNVHDEGCLNFMPDHVRRVDALPDPTPDHAALLTEALRVRDAYIAQRHDGFSFAVDARTHEFIPMHLYFAAVQYLEKTGYTQ